MLQLLVCRRHTWGTESCYMFQELYGFALVRSTLAKACFPRCKLCTRFANLPRQRPQQDNTEEKREGKTEASDH